VIREIDFQFCAAALTDRDIPLGFLHQFPVTSSLANASSAKAPA
jgi:hypothetical protein